MTGVYLYEGDFGEEPTASLIGNVVLGLFSSISAQMDGASSLAAHYGRSYTILRNGFGRMPVAPQAGGSTHDAEIGRRMGGRDHTTVLHGVKKHQQRMAEAEQ